MRLLVRAVVVAALVLAVVAAARVLSASPASAAVPVDTAATAMEAPAILHKLPRPDAVGPMPQRFEWTEVPGAETYSFGLWTEFDVNLVRMDDIAATAVTWPKDAKPLDPGTYYWSVSAFDGLQPIAQSGLAAFVVK